MVGGRPVACLRLLQPAVNIGGGGGGGGVDCGRRKFVMKGGKREGFARKRGKRRRPRAEKGMGKRLSCLRVSQHGGTRGGGATPGNVNAWETEKQKKSRTGKIKDANAAQRKQKCAFLKKIGEGGGGMGRTVPKDQ